MKLLRAVVAVLSVSLAVNTSTTTTTTASAFTISSSQGATQHGSGIHSTVFTISGPEPVRRLAVSSPGHVFVDTNDDNKASLVVSSANRLSRALRARDSDIVARVTITSDSTHLLEALEVVEDAADQIQLKFRNGRMTTTTTGALLTEIVLTRQHELLDVTAAGSSDVVIGRNVLACQDRAASVHLTASGAGDLFVSARDDRCSLNSFTLTTTGSGDIQVQTGGLRLANTLSLVVTGSGDAAVLSEADLQVTQSLECVVSGSGDIFVGSSQLRAQALSSTVSGSGDITLARAGSCQTQKVTVTGSGDVATGAVLCVDTDVSVLGSGDVMVATSNELDIRGFSSSTVKYVGATPNEIKLDHALGHSHKRSDLVRSVRENKYHEYKVRDLPARRMESVHVGRYGAHSGWTGYFPWPHWFGGGYGDSYDDSDSDSDSDSYDFAARNAFKAGTQSMAAQVQSAGSSTWVLIGGVGITLVSVGVAAFKLHQRRARQAFQPLL